MKKNLKGANSRTSGKQGNSNEDTHDPKILQELRNSTNSDFNSVELNESLSKEDFDDSINKTYHIRNGLNKNFENFIVQRLISKINISEKLFTKENTLNNIAAIKFKTTTKQNIIENNQDLIQEENLSKSSNKLVTKKNSLKEMSVNQTVFFEKTTKLQTDVAVKNESNQTNKDFDQKTRSEIKTEQLKKTIMKPSEISLNNVRTTVKFLEITFANEKPNAVEKIAPLENMSNEKIFTSNSNSMQEINKNSGDNINAGNFNIFNSGGERNKNSDNNFDEKSYTSAKTVIKEEIRVTTKEIADNLVLKHTENKDPKKETKKEQIKVENIDENVKNKTEEKALDLKDLQKMTAFNVERTIRPENKIISNQYRLSLVFLLSSLDFMTI